MPSDSTMIRVYADFNSRSLDGACWILRYEDAEIEKRVDDLNIVAGDKVRLFQDENDFEVVAVLDYRYMDILKRKAWVAIPDWSTLVRI